MTKSACRPCGAPLAVPCIYVQVRVKLGGGQSGLEPAEEETTRDCWAVAFGVNYYFNAMYNGLMELEALKLLKNFFYPGR